MFRIHVFFIEKNRKKRMFGITEDDKFPQIKTCSYIFSLCTINSVVNK